LFPDLLGGVASNKPKRPKTGVVDQGINPPETGDARFDSPRQMLA